jgi:S1-C subfamily serine protease
MRNCCAVALVVASLVALAPAQPPEPKHVDDDAVYEQFFNKVETLAKDKKPLAHKDLLAKLKPKAAGVTPTKPGERALTPEEVYKAAVLGVWIVGSTYPDKAGNWQTGTYATAWVLAADGVLVTNWHVFEDLKDGEVFGASDRDGNTYPVTDFLGGDKAADVAVFRVAAKGLKPLPVAPAHAEVGSWVGVISHPGDMFYFYTQGAVTRYSTNTNDDKQIEKWMNISAEYASGSSGGPVLNKFGAVVGMATLTLSIDATDDAKKENPARRKPKLVRAKDDKPKEPAKPNDKGSPQQMVVKMAVPGPVLLKWIGR